MFIKKEDTWLDDYIKSDGWGMDEDSSRMKFVVGEKMKHPMNNP